MASNSIWNVFQTTYNTDAKQWSPGSKEAALFIIKGEPSSSPNWALTWQRHGHLLSSCFFPKMSAFEWQVKNLFMRLWAHTSAIRHGRHVSPSETAHAQFTKATLVPCLCQYHSATLLRVGRRGRNITTPTWRTCRKKWSLFWPSRTSPQWESDQDLNRKQHRQTSHRVKFISFQPQHTALKTQGDCH